MDVTIGIYHREQKDGIIHAKQSRMNARKDDTQDTCVERVEKHFGVLHADFYRNRFYIDCTITLHIPDIKNDGIDEQFYEKEGENE